MKKKTKVVVASILVLAVTVIFFAIKVLLPSVDREESAELDVERKLKITI